MSKPCYPIILHFKTDREPKSICLSSALLELGLSDISILSLATHTTQINTCTNMQLCTLMLHTLTDLQTHTSGMVLVLFCLLVFFLLFFFSGQIHKQVHFLK